MTDNQQGMANDQWKEDVLKVAENFGREGDELIAFAASLREAVEKLDDQDTCWSLVEVFLEQSIERAGLRRKKDA